MVKKFGLILIISTLLLSTSCSSNKPLNQTEKVGINITGTISSIGAVGANINEIETQSYKYTITLKNNETEDINIVSVTPVLNEKFLERVPNRDTKTQVNKTISKGGNLDVSGEIIFNAKGLTKEQIRSMQPFVKEVKITEERKINSSF